jgi:hypothetical protein
MRRGAGNRLGEAAMLLLLCASQTLFLWMFFAAEGLERTALAGGITGPPARDAVAEAHRFAADWRHGMAGGCPLYMPGFFATAVVTWFWAGRKSWRELCAEGFALLSLATLAAALLAPPGTRRVIADFTLQTGLSCPGEQRGYTLVGVLLGVYTLAVWSTFVISSQKALATRSVKPLWLPAALNAVLAVVRPVTVDDFTALWLQRVGGGDATAILSLLLIPCLTALLSWSRWRPISRRPQSGGTPRRVPSRD